MLQVSHGGSRMINQCKKCEYNFYPPMSFFENWPFVKRSLSGLWGHQRPQNWRGGLHKFLIGPVHKISFKSDDGNPVKQQFSKLEFGIFLQLLLWQKKAKSHKCSFWVVKAQNKRCHFRDKFILFKNGYTKNFFSDPKSAVLT